MLAVAGIIAIVAIIISAIAIQKGISEEQPKWKQVKYNNLRVETDKDVYSVGEIINVTVWIVNNKDTALVFEYGEPEYEYSFINWSGKGWASGIHIQYGNTSTPLIIPPHSEYLMQRLNKKPLFPIWDIDLPTGWNWNNPNIESEENLPSAPPGQYQIYVELKGYEFDGAKIITIR